MQASTLRPAGRLVPTISLTPLHPQYRRLPSVLGPSTQPLPNCRNKLRVPHASVADQLQTFIQHASAPQPGLLYGCAANSLVFTLGYRVLRKGLTPVGVAHAWFLGSSVYAAFGLGGHLLVCLYFILGTLVTKLKLKQKQAEGIAEARSGQRGPASVWGSGLAAVICSWLSLLSGNQSLWQIGFVASVCSKLSDTVSSEIGKAYGKTTYLVTTFELVPRGTEGAVSLEGTLAGAAAALLFAGAAVLLGQADLQSALIITAAAILANTFESYLGAVVQGKVVWLSNDLVNMLQILVAATIAVATKTVVAG